MDGTIWLLLWTLGLGFIAGYRYGSGRTSPGFAAACGVTNGRSEGASRRQEIDPVCQEAVSADRAKPSVHEGAIYYFCSRECREIFEAAPPLYIDADGAANVSRVTGNLPGRTERS